MLTPWHRPCGTNVSWDSTLASWVTYDINKVAYIIRAQCLLQWDNLVSHKWNIMPSGAPRETRMRHQCGACRLKCNTQRHNALCVRNHGYNVMTCCCIKKKTWARHRVATTTIRMQKHVVATSMQFECAGQKRVWHTHEPYI